MSAPALQRMLELAINEAETINRQFKHISFITNHQWHIIALGTNRLKTHPMMVQLGYPTNQLHSELDAFNKLSYNDKKKRLNLVNFRLGKNGELRLSKPCKYCLPWCITVFEEIYYTTENGLTLLPNFKKLDK